MPKTSSQVSEMLQKSAADILWCNNSTREAIESSRKAMVEADRMLAGKARRNGLPPSVQSIERGDNTRISRDEIGN